MRAVPGGEDRAHSVVDGQFSFAHMSGMQFMFLSQMKPPGHASPHTTPTSVGFSSVCPLQLSSSPLQISGIGPTVCEHVSPLGPVPIMPLQM